MHKRLCIIFVFFIAVISLTTTARRIRTTRPKLQSTEVATAPGDTIRNPRIYISGYEKTLRSRYESVYIANSYDSLTITSLQLSIEYRDTHGNQLHKRTIDLPTTIPPGERRQVSFPTWDKQCVMYYVKSAPTRRVSLATPYEVYMTPLSITVDKVADIKH